MTLYTTLDSTIDRSPKSTPNVRLAFGGYEYRMAFLHLAFVGVSMPCNSLQVKEDGAGRLRPISVNLRITLL